MSESANERGFNLVLPQTAHADRLFLDRRLYSVRDALTAASSGDEIWVAEGVYTPDANGVVTGLAT